MIEEPGALERTATEVVALARARNREDLAAAIEQESSRLRSGEVAIVVVGETKRGKSSLVNAIVGRRDLAPVDWDLATNVALVVRHADAEIATVYTEDEPEGSTIAIDEVADWATVAGNPWNRKRVTRVDVGVRSPFLAGGAVLVDTPGVGGLDSAHGRMTMATLATADVLLFVLDAGQPIVQPELDFLARSAERKIAVVFALTKTDLFPEWKQILEEDERNIADRAPLFAEAPVMPVSSRMALEAVDESDPALASDLRTGSGLGQLESTLGEQIADVRSSRGGALEERCRVALEELQAQDQRALETATGDTSAADRVQALRERAAEWKKESDSWQGIVKHELAVLRKEIAQNLTGRITELRTRYEGRVMAHEANLEDKLPEEISLDLQALVPELADLIVSRLEEMLDRLRERFELAGIGVASDRELESPDLGQISAPPIIDRSQLWEIVGSIGVGTSGVFLLSSFLGPFAFVVGAAAFIAAARAKRKSEKLQVSSQLRAYVKETMLTASQELSQQIDLVLTALEHEVVAAVQHGIEERSTQLSEEYRELDRLRKADAVERGKAAELATARIAEIQRVRERLWPAREAAATS